MSYLEENKRLAKNTLFLYFRTAIVMLISLYVSRLVLDILGVEDYGIYNIVGSIVVLFSFLNTTLTQASQRFITVELGRKDNSQLQKVFSMSINTQAIIIIVVVLFAETIGLWFLNNKLNLPIDRLVAANWIYQFSILTFCINILRVPYVGSVIAHEKMSFFAYVSILDAVLRLIGVLLLRLISFDKLITYSAIILLIAFIVFLSYKKYCNSNFVSSHYIFFWDKELFRKLITYSGWTLFGSSSNVATQNGFLFIINIYYGVVANAAMGISTQVNHAMASIVSGFQVSSRPQIVKAYSKAECNRFHELISRTSKFSFSLIFIPAILLVINMPLILNVWLKEVPEFTVSFSRLLVICVIFDAISGPYNIAIMSSEKIRNYQLAISLVFISDLLISYLLIIAGIIPDFILISRIVTRGAINLLIGLFFLKRMYEFNVAEYLREVLYPISIVALLHLPIIVFLENSFSGWQLLLFSIIILISLGSPLIYFIVFDSKERNYISKLIKQYI